MKISIKTLPLLGALALSTACIGDGGAGDSDTDNNGTEDDGTVGMTMDMTMTMNMTMNMDTGPDDTGPDDTGPDDTGPDDTGPDTGGSSSTGVDPEMFIFDEAPVEDYTQVDRVGFPAINTGLNLQDPDGLLMDADKDGYNAASPVNDANGDFFATIIDSLNTLHRGIPSNQTNNNTGLDDDLAGVLLVPCRAPQLVNDNCATQAGPFAIPDTLNLTVGSTDGFPNGRRPAEPVMDPIFAVLLLDLTVHGLGTFMDLDGDAGTVGPSLNPLENDVAFAKDWPYLGEAHAE